MILRILSNHAMSVEQTSTTQEADIDLLCSAKHPRMRYIDTRASWDGVYHRFNSKTGRLSRAFLRDVVQLCEEKDYPYQIIDGRSSPKVLPPNADSVMPDILPGITLFDHQLSAVRATCQHEVGIVSSPTGSGKSEMMAAITKIFRCNTIIVADYKIIIDQLKETLELREVAEEIGMFYAGKTPTNQTVVIGTIQSLVPPAAKLKAKKPVHYASRLKRSKLLRDIVGKCELLLVDECDRATSKQYKGLFTRWFTGRRRYGFSGTPFDPAKPVENLFLREFLGNIISHTTREEVQECGLIVPVKYISMALGKRSEQDKAALDIATSENIVESESFHELVADIVEHYKEEKTLILVEFINLGMNLVDAISKRGVKVEFIYGNTSNAARTRAKKRFESGELKCLIGGKILKRGLDLKGGTNNLIMCNGGKLWSDFDQRIGRAVRRNDRGWARVFDFFFLMNFYLYKHSKARLRSLIDMGYDATVVFGDQKIKGEKLVKSNFRFPAKIKERYG